MARRSRGGAAAATFPDLGVWWPRAGIGEIDPAPRHPEPMAPRSRRGGSAATVDVGGQCRPTAAGGPSASTNERIVCVARFGTRQRTKSPRRACNGEHASGPHVQAFRVPVAKALLPGWWRMHTFGETVRKGSIPAALSTRAWRRAWGLAGCAGRVAARLARSPGHGAGDYMAGCRPCGCGSSWGAGAARRPVATIRRWCVRTTWMDGETHQEVLARSAQRSSRTWRVDHWWESGAGSCRRHGVASTSVAG